MWNSVIVLWLLLVCLSQVTGRNDPPETPSPTPKSSTPSPTVTSLASSAPPPFTVDETLFTTSASQTPDATAIANQPVAITPCVPITSTNAVQTTEQPQPTMHSEFPPTLAPAITDPTSALVPTATDTTSTLVPATTDPTSTLVTATTGPTSTLVPTATDPTSTLVPITTDPTSTLVPATTDPTSTLVPASTGLTSTLVPATTGPTSTLVPATTGSTSTLVPATTGPTSTLVPATTGPTSTLVPTTTGPTSTLVPASTGPTPDQPQTTMNSGLRSLLVSATTGNFPTSDQPTTTLNNDLTTAVLSATSNTARTTDQTLASTKAPLPKGTSVSGYPIYEPSLTLEERILRLMESTKLTDRLSFKPPNYDRLVDGTWTFRLSLDVHTSSPDEIHRNLTILLTGTVGFISMGLLELNSTSDDVEAVYEITYSTRDLLSRLPEVKDRFLFALATVPADIHHSVRSVDEVFDTGVESLCVQQQLCPDGYLCHVISQLTCISMCDVTECGDHGHCALNQTFQPICICDAGGTTVYFGDRCEFGREQSAISWGPAAVAGLATSAAVVTGLLMAVSLYLWWVWKGRRPRVSPRVTPDISEQQVVMKGDNSPLQPQLELPNTSLH